MGTELVGKVELANGEQVWVVAWEHELDEATRVQAHRMRNARVTDAGGNRIDQLGFFAFGVNDDGTGMLLDVTIDDARYES